MSTNYLGATNDSYRVISSPENEKIKYIRRLYRKRFREQKGMFLIEGINLIRSALLSDQYIELLIISEDFDYSKISGMLNSKVDRNKIYLVPRSLYERISDTENGSGIIAVVKKQKSDYGLVCDSFKDGKNILILDRLQDPGNIGTIIRTAVATGFNIIAVIKGTADIYSLKALRASAGMIFNIKLIELSGADELRDLANRTNKKIVVTDPKRGIPYFKENLTDNIALVIGNEGNGISKEIMNISDARVNIPMRGNVESLNAAVCASLLMYEAIRNEE